MDPQVEYPRRQRIFRRGLFALAGVELLLIAAWLTGALSDGRAFLFIAPLMLAGLPFIVLGTRWVQRAQPRVEVSPEQAATIAEARQSFVRRRGVLGFGLIWGVSMAVWNTWNAMPAHTLEAFARPAVWIRLSVMLVWFSLWGLAAGWLWGRLMWGMFVPRTETRAE